MNPTNQQIILKDNCDIIDAMVKLIYTARGTSTSVDLNPILLICFSDIILSTQVEDEQISSITIKDAGIY